MKLKVFNSAKKNTTYLQGFGHVEGTPAGELKVGNTLVWNNGETSTVVEIVRETPKTIVILEEYEVRYGHEERDPEGYRRATNERKFLKTRIVARPANELPGNEPENDPSGRATSSQADDQVPSEGSGTDQRDDVVLVTEGPDVDLVTELFDNPDRENLLNDTWEEMSGNAIDVGREFHEQIAKMLSESVNPEEDFDRLAAAFSPASPRIVCNNGLVISPDTPVDDEPKPDDPEYYPNQVTFDRVSRLYEGFNVVGIEEFYTTKDGWRKPEDVIGKNAVSLWNPEELVQYLRDIYAAETFCLVIEDKKGRRKNPDYKFKELVVGLEVGDPVLYVPQYAKGDKSHPDAEKGIVSSVKVDRGSASVWVRYTTGDTGAKTHLSNLYKL